MNWKSRGCYVICMEWQGYWLVNHRTNDEKIAAFLMRLYYSCGINYLYAYQGTDGLLKIMEYTQ